MLIQLLCSVACKRGTNTAHRSKWYQPNVCVSVLIHYLLFVLFSSLSRCCSSSLKCIWLVACTVVFSKGSGWRQIQLKTSHTNLVVCCCIDSCITGESIVWIIVYFHSFWLFPLVCPTGLSQEWEASATTSCPAASTPCCRPSLRPGSCQTCWKGKKMKLYVHIALLPGSNASKQSGKSWF